MRSVLEVLKFLIKQELPFETQQSHMIGDFFLIRGQIRKKSEKPFVENHRFFFIQFHFLKSWSIQTQRRHSKTTR